MITAEHLNFRYSKDTPVLEDVSFTLDRGESLCLLGPNGTGKTTLFRCLLQFCRLKGGVVRIDGTDIRTLSPRARARRIAYVPQASALSFPYTVRETVLMGRVAHKALGTAHNENDQRIVNEALEQMGVLDLAEHRFHELSGGERQLVLVARALAQQTDYLILDEPTASLDYANQIRILQVIRDLTARGYSILMTSHFPDHAFLAATRVLLLRDGKVFAEGTPDTTVTSENLTALYGLMVCVTDAAVTFPTEKEGVWARVCIPQMK